MTDLELLPDSETAVKAWLTGLGYRAFRSLPPDWIVAEQGEAVTIHRVAGASDDNLPLDRPVLQLDCWGPDADAASLLARRINRDLLLLEGTVVDLPDGSAARLLTASVQGVTWQPDPTDGTPRYVVTVEVRVAAADSPEG